MNNNIINVLDNGFVELIDMFGDELTIVNAARVSFGNQRDELRASDLKLMKYLHQHKHFSPFRHLMFRFRIKAPEFVMRQLYKHVVGIETSSSYPTKDHAWNEISGRYKPVESYYIPYIWRCQSNDSKQASDGQLNEIDNEIACQLFNETISNNIDTYNRLLELGVAKEQARIILPLNQYTEIYWTCSAQAVFNFIELRDDEHSQHEIRVYAQALKTLIRSKIPNLYKIWFEE
jgi:thymidylate synthase (FAD)